MFEEIISSHMHRPYTPSVAKSSGEIVRPMVKGGMVLIELCADCKASRLERDKRKITLHNMHSLYAEKPFEQS